MTALDRRAEVIAGLRELADFLEANPDLPVDRHARLTVYPGTDTPTEGDAAQRAEVDAAATILGTQPATTFGGHYEVTRQFSGVAYYVCHIPDEVLARHDAEVSYRDNIRAAS